MHPRILIKIGGRAFEGESGFKDLAGAITSTPNCEIIIVHGGGAEISAALKKANRDTVFIDGIRVTQAEDIQIVEAVLSGTINRRIAEWLSLYHVPCRQMSGKTDHLFVVEPLIRNGRKLGYVGQIKQVNPAVVLDAMSRGEVPVVSPISGDKSGQSYNVNADTAAAALAGGARCSDLVFITDVPGVLVDGAPCPRLSADEARRRISDGTIQGGMVAKMEAAFEALNCNVPRVHIIQWQGPDTLRRIINQEKMSGTTVVI